MRILETPASLVLTLPNPPTPSHPAPTQTKKHCYLRSRLRTQQEEQPASFFPPCHAGYLATQPMQPPRGDRERERPKSCHRTHPLSPWGETPGVFISTRPHLLEGAEPGLPPWARQRRALAPPLRPAQGSQANGFGRQDSQGAVGECLPYRTISQCTECMSGGASHIRNSLTTPTPHAHLAGSPRSQSREWLPRGGMLSCLDLLASSFSIRGVGDPSSPQTIVVSFPEAGFSRNSLKIKANFHG